MVLEKQDSGVYLSATGPSSPTEAASVARPVAFFVDVGGPAAGAGAGSVGSRKLPTTSSASVRAPPQDGVPRRTSSQRSPMSTSSARPVSKMPRKPQGDTGTSGRKTIGQRFFGALQKLHVSTKVSNHHACSIIGKYPL